MFKEYVEKNLSLLEGKMSDMHCLLNLLVENDIISGNERDDIDEENKTDAKKAKKLWQILKTKDDEVVSKIISCLNKTKCAKAVANCLQKYQPDVPEPDLPASPVTNTGAELMCQRQRHESLNLGEDFVVQQKHVKLIASCLTKTLNLDSWALIKKSWLSQEILNQIATNSNMKMDVTDSISAWISKTQRAQRLYSKIVEAVQEESIAAQEELESIHDQLKVMA